jgi:transcriptional regulator
MYVPVHFLETRVELLQALIERHPLGTLVAVTAAGITANHVPMLAALQEGGRGRLRGHIARSNSLWRDLQPDAAVLAIFSGADHYISPTWYPSKREHGKAVPTWNYATVHLKGTIRFIEDGTWLREFVGELTDVFEQGRPNRWHMSDSSPDYIQGMLRAIVGFEIEVTDIGGKFKGSQNRPVADREGVRSALAAEVAPTTDMSELVRDPDPS